MNEGWLEEVSRCVRRERELLDVIAAVVWVHGTTDETGRCRTLRFPRMLLGYGVVVETFEDPETLDTVVRVGRKRDGRVPSPSE